MIAESSTPRLESLTGSDRRSGEPETIRSTTWNGACREQSRTGIAAPVSYWSVRVKQPTILPVASFPIADLPLPSGHSHCAEACWPCPAQATITPGWRLFSSLHTGHARRHGSGGEGSEIGSGSARPRLLSMVSMAAVTLACGDDPVIGLGAAVQPPPGRQGRCRVVGGNLTTHRS